MSFTTAQLAAQVNSPNLDTWISTTPQTQTPAQVAAFTAYFDNLQTWITTNNGANPFSWDNVAGLTHNNRVQVVLNGPQDKAPFNDAFDDVRTHLGTSGFRLFQAAEAVQRLIKALTVMN